MDNNNQPDNGNNNKGTRNQLLVMLIAALITLTAVTLMKNAMTSAKQKEISYDQFVTEVNAGEIEAVTITNTEILVDYKSDAEKNPVVQHYVVRLEGDYGLVDRLVDHGVKVNRERQDSSMLLESILSFVLPFICIVIFMNFMMKKMGGGIMGVGKSTAKMYMQKETGVKRSRSIPGSLVI